MSNFRRKTRVEASDASRFRFAIVMSDYHAAPVEALLEGARNCLESHRVGPESVPVFRVPGVFEIPQAIARLLARSDPRPHAVIALGILLRGETIHFETLAHEVVRGLGAIGRSTGVPVSCGVLTVDTDRQARDRTGRGESNKGWEAARAAVRMASLFQTLERPASGPRGEPRRSPRLRGK